MNALVALDQSAFLKRRCILDYIARAEELIFSLHKRKLPGYILKVDFAKAFDLVDWDFLLDLLLARGFGERWIGWIKSLLISSKESILVNGNPNGYIRYKRGLQHGDPLSLLLFVLVTNVLSAMFNHALNSKILIGVPLGDFGNKCNLHYADDLLILTSRGLEDLRVVKLILMGELPDWATAETLHCNKGLGGWGILDLLNFNQALLGKWWVKYMMDPDWGGAKDYFARILQLPSLPLSLEDLWSRWRSCLRLDRRPFGDSVSKVIIWNIWLGRNDYIFNANVLSAHCIIVKTDRLLLSWCSSIAEGPRAKMEDDISAVRRSLEFLGPRVQDFGETRTSEKTIAPGSARFLWC
ncbi:uncharacterized protein LOC120267198 [Dioscorea cayenensis subsp. rotundata]|uniref:Uncharacterized protein LOC120267198 n=1 Tax=Dioscorea cayennensis subsp. rotundata TaxID=55577 RepID=A0AB40BV59_DIOCR|nr:uncharacterized protein LOC120267198 [Dioscorea cayenensis subsp. rotundata]